VIQVAHYGAVGSLILLALLCVTWETFLAPLRPGGSMLMLKALPLLVPLFGVLRERVRAYQWTSLLALGYFCEGVVRSWVDTGLSRTLAQVEIVLSLVLFASSLAYVRARRRAAS
jgi:uncharacterized membrane protein